MTDTNGQTGGVADDQGSTPNLALYEYTQDGQTFQAQLDEDDAERLNARKVGEVETVYAPGDPDNPANQKNDDSAEQDKAPVSSKSTKPDNKARSTDSKASGSHSATQ